VFANSLMIKIEVRKIETSSFSCQQIQQPAGWSSSSQQDKMSRWWFWLKRTSLPRRRF